MSKGRTAESTATLSANIPDLEKQVADLKAERIKMGRFKEIDREKAELDSILRQKSQIATDNAKLIAQTKAKCAEMEAEAKANVLSIIAKGNSDAKEVTNQANIQMDKVKAEITKMNKVQADIKRMTQELQAERKAFDLAVLQHKTDKDKIIAHLQGVIDNL